MPHSPHQTTYLALGSNRGDKMHWLQKAVKLIFEHIGNITAVSKIYKTPAWGFEGNDFLNACIEVSTRLSAEKTLEKLLRIEEELGRVRSKNGYDNRNIDLDIVFFGNEQKQDKNLTVPHPKMSERRFVLAPLADIAPDLIHPIKKQSISELLQKTSDRSEIEETKEKLEIPKLSLEGLNHLAIEGVIGAGKSSLTRMIAEDFNGKPVLERFKDNPFLPKYYKEPQRYAFALEMSFLAERYQQFIDHTGQYELFHDFVISDYDFNKSMIFAEITLQPEELLLYKKLFQIIHKNLPRPDLYVYLYQTTDRLLENIKKRGRDYEQNISAEYLEKLNKRYLEFIKSQSTLNIKIIDISELNFVKNREDYLMVLREIVS